MTRTSFAPGKIILSGEYAVVFGYPGIAIPSSLGIEAKYDEDSSCETVQVRSPADVGGKQWLSYAETIVGLCALHDSSLRGKLRIRTNLPIGKGMGSSTAFVIAIAHALLGDDSREQALSIEDKLNPGHSGLDFATIWNAAPVLLRRGRKAVSINLPPELLHDAVLIDTGKPSEPTKELVAWMKSRRSEVEGVLKSIGSCTERLVKGEPLANVMRDHHRAQVALGVVPPEVQEMITVIESVGGAAKVVGAGSRTGGAGTVLALGNKRAIERIADRNNMSTMTL